MANETNNTYDRFLNQTLQFNPDKVQTGTKTNISEEEAIDIYNELLEVLMSHNVSYEIATRLSISFAYAFQIGEAELRKKSIIP